MGVKLLTFDLSERMSGLQKGDKVSESHQEETTRKGRPVCRAAVWSETHLGGLLFRGLFLCVTGICNGIICE